MQRRTKKTYFSRFVRLGVHRQAWQARCHACQALRPANKTRSYIRFGGAVKADSGLKHRSGLKYRPGLIHRVGRVGTRL